MSDAMVTTRAEEYPEEHAHHHDDHGHLTPQETLENAKFAMWLYIGSEIMIFSGMLAAYLVFRRFNYESVALAKEHLSIPLVSFNTFLLLASSWAMVMGLRAVQSGNNRGLVNWLSLTVIMGAAFVGLQVVEYAELAHNGVVLTVPTQDEVAAMVETDEMPEWLEEGIAHTDFAALAETEIAVEGGTAPAEGAAVLEDAPTVADGEITRLEQATLVAQNLAKYGQRFYAPTAFHGAHVIVGCLWGLWVINRGWRNKFTSERYAAVEVFGLYWHFVDVVWIILFTFIYLI